MGEILRLPATGPGQVPSIASFPLLGGSKSSVKCMSLQVAHGALSRVLAAGLKQKC